MNNTYTISTKSGGFKVKNLFMFKGFCNNWALTPEIINEEERLVKFSGESDGYLTDRIIEENESGGLTYAWFENELLEIMEEGSEVLYMQKENGLITLTKNTVYKGALETDVLMLNESNIADLKSWLS